MDQSARESKSVSIGSKILIGVISIAVVAVLSLIILMIESRFTTGDAFTWTHGYKHYKGAQLTYLGGDQIKQLVD